MILNQELLHPLPYLSYNYVFSGTRNNNPVILKLGFDIASLAQEAKALTTLNGPRVQVFEIDHSCNALLLEQVLPGTSLRTYFPTQDRKAIEITCNLIKSFRTSEAAFTPVAQLLSILDNDYPKLYIHQAKAHILSPELLTTTKTICSCKEIYIVKIFCKTALLGALARY